MQKHIFNIHDVILFMTVAECILLVIFQAILPAKNQHLIHLVPIGLTITWLLVFQIDSSDLRFKTLGQTETERQIANGV